MNRTRTLHLYLGCFFAPMILYFSISGVWQVFRLNDLPRPEQEHAAQSDSQANNPGGEDESNRAGQPAPRFRILLHELSKPHKEATLPGRSPRKSHSLGFDWFAAALGFGLSMTTLLGVALAWQVPRRRKKVFLAVLAGILLPMLLLAL